MKQTRKLQTFGRNSQETEHYTRRTKVAGPKSQDQTRKAQILVQTRKKQKTILASHKLA